MPSTIDSLSRLLLIVKLYITCCTCALLSVALLSVAMLTIERLRSRDWFDVLSREKCRSVPIDATGWLPAREERRVGRWERPATWTARRFAP
jgi:hypothetical protein